MTRLHTPLQHIRAVAAQLVDARVGIIHALETLPIQPGSPEFFYYAAQTCNLAACGWQPHVVRMEAMSSDRESAALQAIADALRFYSAAFYDPDELMLYSRDAAPFPCTAAADFALYAAEQYEQPDFPFVPFDNATPIRWVPATNLSRNQICYVPAVMVHLPYEVRPGTGEAAILPPTATGLATACSPAEAAIAALCSAVQDDALAIAWQAQLAMPHIRIETLSDHNYDLVERFERTAGQVTLLDLTMDCNLPVVLASLQRQAKKAPTRVIAGGAALEPEHAVRMALENLALTLFYSQQIQAHVTPLPPKDGYPNVVDPASHLNFWCDPANTPLADGMFQSKERIEFDEMPCMSSDTPSDSQRALVDKIGQAGYDVLLVDLTTPDLANLGLSVVRAVVPGFQPLCAGHQHRVLGSARLRELPGKLGYPSMVQPGADHPAPHPYLIKGICP